jgi:hypothetical protein
MMNRFRSTIVTTFIAVVASIAGMQQIALAQPLKPPAVPFGLDAPEGTVPYIEGHASGTQNYICLPSATGFAWTFFSPQATLFTDIKFFQKDIQQQIITHFLSPNPDEDNLARVTWQSSLDTSAVWAKAAKSSVDSSFVAVGAIPWVLLDVVGARPGPAGGALLTPAVAIQRVNTHGGAAPATGCTQATDVGATALSPYTADYFFYRKAHPSY